MNEETDRVELARGPLGAVLLAAHEEKSRYAMNGVQVHRSGALVATDGKILLGWTPHDVDLVESCRAHEVVGDSNACVLERKSLARLLADTKVKDEPYTVNMLDQDTAALSTNAIRPNGSRSVGVVGGNPPASGDLLAGARAHKGPRIAVGAKGLLKLAKAAIAHGGKDAVVSIRLAEGYPGGKVIHVESRAIQNDGIQTTLEGLLTTCGDK